MDTKSSDREGENNPEKLMIMWQYKAVEQLGDLTRGTECSPGWA